MLQEEVDRLSRYLQKLFSNKDLLIKPRRVKDGSVELYKKDEFLGTIYKEDEDGEVCYNFTMAILDTDLD